MVYGFADPLSVHKRSVEADCKSDCISRRVLSPKQASVRAHGTRPQLNHWKHFVVSGRPYLALLRNLQNCCWFEQPAVGSIRKNEDFAKRQWHGFAGDDCCGVWLNVRLNSKR